MTYANYETPSFDVYTCEEPPAESARLSAPEAPESEHWYYHNCPTCTDARIVSWEAANRAFMQKNAETCAADPAHCVSRESLDDALNAGTWCAVHAEVGD